MVGLVNAGGTVCPKFGNARAGGWLPSGTPVVPGITEPAFPVESKKSGNLGRWAFSIAQVPSVLAHSASTIITRNRSDLLKKKVHTSDSGIPAP